MINTKISFAKKGLMNFDRKTENSVAYVLIYIVELYRKHIQKNTAKSYIYIYNNFRDRDRGSGRDRKIEREKLGDTVVDIYIYMCISSSSSSYRAGSTDIPDPLSPLLPIVHRPR